MTRLDRAPDEQHAAEEWRTYGSVIDSLARVPNGVTALLDALASGDIKARLVDPSTSPPATGNPILDEADPTSTRWWQLYNTRRRALPDLEQEWTAWLRNCVEVQQAPALRMSNNPITREQLRKAVWEPLKIRTIRRQLKELRTGIREHRGRPKSYHDQDFIRLYVEVEALALYLTGGVVLKLLRQPNLRLIADDGKPMRLNRKDKQRLRQQYAEGKREALAWRDTRFMGRPHPRWSEIQRCIGIREAQLGSSARSELFFLKKM